MTKKAEKSIRKTIYRHPVGALRVFCSVMLLAMLGVCGYAGSARTKNVPSAVSLPVIRTELEGDAIGGGSIAEVRARLNRQREAIRRRRKPRWRRRRRLRSGWSAKHR